MDNNLDINKIYSSNNNYDDKQFWDSINKVRLINDEYYEKTGKRKKSLTAVYGCQMNEHDNEKIGWMLELMGYTPTENLEEADFMLFNTCAIRENAELKVYGKIGSLKTMKEENPDIKIAVCGCMMQIEAIRETIETKYSHVDMIFGTHNIHKFPELFAQNIDTGKMAIEVLEDSLDIIEGMEDVRNSKTTAYVNIMFGCNNFCTYCVVPYTRGREISRQPKDILDEVKQLAEDGYKEVMLLGQNVNSYGKNLDVAYNFTDLITDIDKIKGIERIRFMTSHPRDISDELIEAYGKLEHLENHLHLPVQSGSNNILKKMNRHYTREKYLDTIKKIKTIRPDIALSTDIIVGFPGETEEDFQATLDLIKEVEYDFVYNFIYSIRPGTKAGKMDGQIPYDVKHDRFQRLSDEINKISLKKNTRLVGSLVNILVEDTSKTNEDMLSGRTSDFKLVHFKGDKSLIGKLVDVKIIKAGTFSLEGELV